MQIRYLKLSNFRNYSKLQVNFDDKLNLIYGKNGMGKTNIVEAIYVLALTKSFRTSKDDLLIKKEEVNLKIEGTIFDGTEKNFKLILNETGKKVKINNNKVPKLSNYISKFNVILFSPDDLKMIKDSPNVRRKILNMELSELNNEYLKLMNFYNKVLKQRNAYLKTIYINANASREYLDILTNQLINYGGKVYQIRNVFFERINEKINNIYCKITGTEGLKIKYDSDFEVGNDKIYKKFKSNENKDVILGQTNLGIQKDDYHFYVNNDDLKDFGSEGQQKNAVIAYKMAEMEIFFEDKNSYPVLILDDLFSELDNEKIANILNLLDEKVQTFITTTDIDKLKERILEKCKIFYVENGILEEVS